MKQQAGSPKVQRRNRRTPAWQMKVYHCGGNNIPGPTGARSADALQSPALVKIKMTINGTGMAANTSSSTLKGVSFMLLLICFGQGEGYIRYSEVQKSTTYMFSKDKVTLSEMGNHLFLFTSRLQQALQLLLQNTSVQVAPKSGKIEPPI